MTQKQQNNHNCHVIDLYSSNSFSITPRLLFFCFFNSSIFFLFDIDEDTEQDIKDVIKTVGVIATILFAGGAIDGIGSDDDKED